MSHIEVEARALLSSDQREKMLAYMHMLGEVSTVKRVMIDYSGANRERTVVLRINNGAQSLVAKTGKLADTVRQEAEVIIASEQSLEDTLSYLAIIGHTQAMISMRTLFVIRHEGLEYSVRDVLDQDTLERVSTLLDIEAMDTQKGSEAAAQHAVEEAFAKHDLSPLSATEWEQWVDDTYKQVDRTFVYSPEQARSLAILLAGQPV
jgi:hypothetical protein